MSIAEPVVDFKSAHNIAEEAWKGVKNTIGALRCEKCRKDWSKAGSNMTNRPPRFPANYVGDCPTCGGKLTKSGVCG